MGIEEPRISLIHCVEEVNERHFPYTVGYRDIVAQAREGQSQVSGERSLDLKTRFCLKVCG